MQWDRRLCSGIRNATTPSYCGTFIELRREIRLDSVSVSSIQSFGLASQSELPFSLVDSNHFFTSLTRISNNRSTSISLEDFGSSGSANNSYVTQRRYLGSSVKDPSRNFIGAFYRTCGGQVGNWRYFSTSTEESVTTKYADHIANVINDTIEAADSAFLVASVQYLINGVHSLTGWSSIVVSTLLVRGVTVPFLIAMLKANSKLMLIRPRLEEIQEQIQAKGIKPQAIDEGKKKMKELFDEYGVSFYKKNRYGVSPSAPYKEVFIQSPIIIISYLAIANMTMKTPSFKTGGALWFTDLTTPDEMYIFPVLIALTSFRASGVLFKLQKGHTNAMPKIDARVLALLSLPFSMILPKAILCYWITSNIFALCYESIPGIKKALGILSIHSTSNDTRKAIRRKIIKKR